MSSAFASGAAVAEGDLQRADVLGTQVLELAGQLGETCDDPEVIEELSLKQQACQLEYESAWAAAEAIYHKLLARAEQAGSPFCIVIAASDLAGLYAMCDRYVDALEVHRKLSKFDQLSDCKFALGMAATSHASYALKVNEVDEALAVAAKGLELLASDDSAHDIIRARLKLLVAECHLRMDCPDQATLLLEDALQTVERLAQMPSAAGAKEALLRARRLQAELAMQQGNSLQAQQCWEQVVSIARDIHALPHVADRSTLLQLANCLHQWSSCLNCSGDSAASEEALAECNAIREALDLPPV